jgi:hypothetical protein
MTELAERETTEVYALDLDWEVIQHLALPESIGYFRAEQFTSDLLEDDLARQAFTWQMDHYREHGQPATASVLEDQFPDVVVEDPQTSVGDLIERVRTRYMRNKGREIAKNIAIAVNENPLEAPKMMMRGGRELTDLVVRRGEVFGTGRRRRTSRGTAPTSSRRTSSTAGSPTATRWSFPPTRLTCACGA